MNGREVFLPITSLPSLPSITSLSSFRVSSSHTVSRLQVRETCAFQCVFSCCPRGVVLCFRAMSEWWKTTPAMEIVDGFIQDLYSPQYPSAGVYMHISDEETLSKVRAVILRAEVASAWTQRTLRWVASRPHQYHQIHMPHDALKENREVYATLIRELIELGVVREIKANYGF